MNDDEFQKLLKHREIVLLLQTIANTMLVVGVLGLFLLLAVCSLLFAIAAKL